MDRSVIQKAIDGNTEAFEMLYRETHDKGYSVAYSILKDSYEAEDILQEAYISMFQKINTLQNLNGFESWFYRIVRNAALDFLRKQRPELFSSFENDDNEDFNFTDTIVSDYTPFNPEENMDYEETKRIMAEIVDSLPDMQKRCIQFRFQKDMKISEIAASLEIPESTVKSNLTYGKKKIEEEVKKLEKKGVRLYSVTPALIIPFLRWMYGNQVPASLTAAVSSTTGAAITEAAVTAEAAQVSAATSAVVSSSATTTASITTAVKAAGAGLATKIIAGVCAVSLLGGGIAVATQKASNSDLNSATEIISIAETEHQCEHTWKAYFCTHVDNSVVPSTFYGCTACGATVIADGCPHPEIVEYSFAYDGKTIVNEECTLCGNYGAHYNQYLSPDATGGEGLPNLAFPNTYREAEENNGCNHIWIRGEFEAVDTGLMEPLSWGITHYTCAECGKQVTGYGNSCPHPNWVNNPEWGMYECTDCGTIRPFEKGINDGDINCTHTTRFKFYTHYGEPVYYEVCADCCALVLHAVPVETVTTPVGENNDELEKYVADFLTFYLPTGCTREDISFTCIGYQLPDGNYISADSYPWPSFSGAVYEPIAAEAYAQDYLNGIISYDASLSDVQVEILDDIAYFTLPTSYEGQERTTIYAFRNIDGHTLSISIGCDSEEFEQKKEDYWTYISRITVNSQAESTETETTTDLPGITYLAYKQVLQKHEAECPHSLDEYPDALTYTLYDINKDGTPELLVCYGVDCFVYTMSGGTAVYCDGFNAYWGLLACEDNGLIVNWGGITGQSFRQENMTRYTLSNGTLVDTGETVSTRDETANEYEEWNSKYERIQDFYSAKDYSLLKRECRHSTTTDEPTEVVSAQS